MNWWMTARRFAWLLHARGTHVAAWPDAERTGALALLRRSRAARHMLADALGAEDAPEPDGPVLARMQRGLRLRMAPPPAVVRGMGWGALAACAAAGLYVGIGAAQPDAAPDLFASAEAATFAALEQ